MVFCHLLKERSRAIILEAQSWLTFSGGSDFLALLLSLEVALQRIEEESIMGYAVPVEDLLFLLGPDAVVLVEKVEEGALWLFQGCVGAGFEVTQV